MGRVSDNLLRAPETGGSSVRISPVYRSFCAASSPASSWKLAFRRRARSHPWTSGGISVDDYQYCSVIIGVYSYIQTEIPNVPKFIVRWTEGPLPRLNSPQTRNAGEGRRQGATDRILQGPNENRIWGFKGLGADK